MAWEQISDTVEQRGPTSFVVQLPHELLPKRVVINPNSGKLQCIHCTKWESCAHIPHVEAALAARKDNQHE